VSFIDPEFGNNDENPPSDIRQGQHGAGHESGRGGNEKPRLAAGPCGG
jgi:hypothetical protein